MAHSYTHLSSAFAGGKEGEQKKRETAGRQQGEGEEGGGRRRREGEEGNGGEKWEE